MLVVIGSVAVCLGMFCEALARIELLKTFPTRPQLVFLLLFLLLFCGCLFWSFAAFSHLGSGRVYFEVAHLHFHLEMIDVAVMESKKRMDEWRAWKRGLKTL